MKYKKLILKTNAAVEIEEIMAFYASKNLAIYKKFSSELRKAFQVIQRNPESFQYRYSKIRVFWLRKFPYGLYYFIEEQEIVIIAFWHSKEDIPNKLPKIL